MHTAAKKITTTRAADCFPAILLDKVQMTTEMLERLTGTTIVTESRNMVRDNCISRLSVLVGAGTLFVFARSSIDLSLLPGEAAASLLEGCTPLGGILRLHSMQTERQNFIYFTLEAERLLPSMFRPLAPVSGSFRRWLRRPLPFSPAAAGPASYYGRSYDIRFQGQVLAHIEEIFSPALEKYITGWAFKRMNV